MKADLRNVINLNDWLLLFNEFYEEENNKQIGGYIRTTPLGAIR